MRFCPFLQQHIKHSHSPRRSSQLYDISVRYLTIAGFSKWISINIFLDCSSSVPFPSLWVRNGTTSGQIFLHNLGHYPVIATYYIFPDYKLKLGTLYAGKTTITCSQPGPILCSISNHIAPYITKALNRFIFYFQL